MKFKIGTKIGIIFLLFFIQAFLTWIFIYTFIAYQTTHYFDRLQEEVEEMNLVRDFHFTVAKVHVPIHNFIISGDPNKAEDFKVLSAKVENLIESGGKLEFNQPEERKLFTRIKDKYSQIKKIALLIFSIPDPVGNREARRLMGEMGKIVDDTSMDTEKFYQVTQQEVKEIQAAWQKTKTNLNLFILGGILFNPLLILAGLLFIRRTISLPLISIRDAASEVGKGNLGKSVKAGSNDEIGDLANSFNKMVKNLKDSKDELISLKSYTDSIIANMADTLVVVDHEGLIKRVNPATVDLLGYTEKELVGQPVAKIFKEQETSNEIKESTIEKIINSEPVVSFETYYKTKVGEVIPVSFSSSVMRGEDGNMVGIVCVARDIRQLKKQIENEKRLAVATAEAEAGRKRALELEDAYANLEQSKEAALNIMEDLNYQTKELEQEIIYRKNAEEELKNAYREVELLANLVENSHEMVFVLKSDGSILKSNFMARDIFGYSINEMAEHKIMSLLKSGIDMDWKAIIDYALRELYWRGDLTAVCSDGHRFPANVAISSPADVEAGGKSDNLICFVRDVTREKEIDRMKSEFISTVSHELRTPLSITREGISLILDRISGEINENQEKLLSTAMSNIDRLARIINDLLDISKIEADKLELKRKVIDISGLLNQVFLSFEPKGKSRGLLLRSDFPKRRIEIYADEDKMNQVFVNLIGNSIKFTEKGYIEIMLIEKENEIDCIIADTGIGISKEDMPRLFGRFQQFGRTAGPGEKGTGLGLSIVKNIIEMHGGRIEVNSALNKGTVFTITLPKHTTFNILKEYIKSGLKEAAKKDTYFTLVSINMLNFNKIENSMSKDKAEMIFRALVDEVKKLLRRTCDVLVEAHSDIFILLPDTTKKGALVVLDRIKQIFETFVRTQDIEELKELKINFMTITYPDEVRTYEDFIKKTKEARKWQKRSYL